VNSVAPSATGSGASGLPPKFTTYRARFVKALTFLRSRSARNTIVAVKTQTSTQADTHTKLGLRSVMEANTKSTNGSPDKSTTNKRGSSIDDATPQEWNTSYRNTRRTRAMKEHLDGAEKSDFFEQAKALLADQSIPDNKYESKSDPVHQPAHYQGDVECIDVMVQVFGWEMVRDFAIVNAFKYQFRCMNKHESPDEDLKKAVWWLRFAVDDDPRKDS
jgi:hypothetical protein